ncbi:type II toxin-antitoxin system ParD family antitoxin [Crocosphaera sp.]|uniref:type II toxin-antitoxin system ParD family antitoxin n=1 Tax=Crocosphaera sp. TaxID=2729996 RepID=UPI00262D8A84|nr:type II toxin-antitoxin system ParD family antitoxin [Crocosphaera sp.]MDJ0578482.1 type II toxin-antitoxin system ParD family antitoxin [Crocosphaera sp.]
MNITLSPEQEKFIQSQIARGNYQDVEQVIKEALTILEIINQQNDQKRLEELKQKIALGLEDVKQGNVRDGELVFERLQERLR